MSLRSSRGFSLVEVLVTMVIVCLLLGAALQYFAATRQQAVGSDVKLNSVLLAQMVLERLRSNVTANPGFFRAVGATNGAPWSVTGTVVDPQHAVSGGSAPLSPFFENLFASAGTDLFTDGNLIAISRPAGAVAAGTAAARQAGLLASFRDYLVSVQVEDDLDPDPAAGASKTSELVKRVTVTVARASAGAKDPGAFTLSTRMATPAESLSTTALENVNASFDGFNMDLLYRDFFEAMKGNLYFEDAYIGVEAKKLLADCYLLLATLNTEAYMVEGRTLAGTIVLTNTIPTRSLENNSLNPAGPPGWIPLLERTEFYAHSIFKKQVARLRGTKMRIQFDAFKRALPILQDLEGRHQVMLPEIDRIIAALKVAQEKFVQLNDITMQAMKDYNQAKADRDFWAARSKDTKLREDGARLIAEADELLVGAGALLAEADTLGAEALDLEARADSLAEVNANTSANANTNSNASTEPTTSPSAESSSTTTSTTSGSVDPSPPSTGTNETSNANNANANANANANSNTSAEDPQVAALRAAAADKRKAEAAKRQAAKVKSDLAISKRAAGTAKIAQADAKLSKDELKMKAAEARMAAAMKIMQDQMLAFSSTLESQGTSLVQVLQTVAVCKFLSDFFTDKNYRQIVDRLKMYPVWLKETSEAMSRNLNDHLAQTAGPTPLDQMSAAHMLLEVTKIRQLQNVFPSEVKLDGELAKLNTLADAVAPRQRELARYLKASEVHDLAQLKLRNDRFLKKLQILKDSNHPDYLPALYLRVVSRYDTGGRITDFLDFYTKVSSEIRLSSDTILVQMQRQIQTLRRTLEYIGETTADEILKAIKSVDVGDATTSQAALEAAGAP